MKKLASSLLFFAALGAGCPEPGPGSTPHDLSSMDSDSRTAPEDAEQDSLPPLPDVEEILLIDLVDAGLGPDNFDGHFFELPDAGSDTGDLLDVSEEDAEVWAGEPSWTLMIYMNGDNSLSEEAGEDLDEIVSAGWDPHVRVVILMDTLHQGGLELVLGPDGLETLDDPGEIDMADWTVLRDFALRSVAGYPAERYGLILWNHGSGWTKPSIPGIKGFSNDDHGVFGEMSVAKGELTDALTPVAEALGAPLDLLGLDMCLMGMWEVAVAAEGAATVLVSSQETEPSDGWDYTTILDALSVSPDMDAPTLAGVIVDSYHDEDPDNSTLAALDLAALPAVTEAVGQLAVALLAVPDQWDALETARTQSMWFDDDFDEVTSPHRDLYSLAAEIDQALNPSEEIQAATVAVRDALDAAVLLNAVQSGFGEAHGLSIHLPGRDGWFLPTYLDEIAPWSGTPWTTLVDGFSNRICDAWTCDWDYFGVGDGCDCACGCWDPDCDDDPDPYGCEDDQVCVPPGLCQDAPGPCEAEDTACAGDVTLGTCADGQWTLTPCQDLLTCTTPGPFAGPVCWDPSNGPASCHCWDDPGLCDGVSCGTTDLGVACGDCPAGALCHDRACYAQGPCQSDEILDCVGQCGELDWLGDDMCDDGKWDVDFNCEAFDYDDGDC